jgi:hypothetical protein
MHFPLHLSDSLFLVMGQLIRKRLAKTIHSQGIYKKHSKWDFLYANIQFGNPAWLLPCVLFHLSKPSLFVVPLFLWRRVARWYKFPIWEYFGRLGNGKYCYMYFIAVWDFMVFWYMYAMASRSVLWSFSKFGMLYQEKSGNPTSEQRFTCSSCRYVHSKMSSR